MEQVDWRLRHLQDHALVLLAALKFCRSVMAYHGVYELSEKIAVARADDAIAATKGLPEHQEASARLRAAAPALLVALKEASRHISFCSADCVSKDGCPLPDEEGQCDGLLLFHMRAAIAAAEGVEHGQPG